MYYIFKLSVANDATLLNGMDYNNIAYSTTKKNMVVKIKDLDDPNNTNGLLKEVGVTQANKSGAMYINDIYDKLDTNIKFSTDSYNPHAGDILISRNGEFIPHDIFHDDNTFEGEITFKNLVFDAKNVLFDDMIITKNAKGDMTFQQPVVSVDDKKGLELVNNQFRVNIDKTSLETSFLNEIIQAMNNYKTNMSYTNITNTPLSINNDDDSIYINTKFTELAVTLTTNANLTKIITIFSDEDTKITFDSNSSIPLYTIKGHEKKPIVTAKEHILYFDGINKSVYIINSNDLNDTSALQNPTLNTPGIIKTNKSEFLFDQVNDDVVDRIPNVITPYILKNNILRLTNKLDELFSNMNIPEIKDIGSRKFKGVVEYNHGSLRDSRLTIDGMKKELVSGTNDVLEIEETYKRSISGLNNPENIDLKEGDIEYSSTSTSIIEITGMLRHEDEIRLTLEGIDSYSNNTKRTKGGSVDSDALILDHIKVTPVHDDNDDITFYSKVTIRNINNNYLLAVIIETKLSNGVKYDNELTVDYFTISDIAFSKWNTDLISKDAEESIYLITNIHDNNTIITKKHTKLANTHGNNVFYDNETKEFSERTNNQVLLPRYNSIVTSKDKLDLDLRNNNNYDAVGKNIKSVNIYNPTKNVLQHSNIYKFFSTNNEMNVKVDGNYDIELFSSPTGSSDYGIDTKQSKFCVLEENKDKVFDVGYGNTIVDTRENQSMITDTAIVSQSNIVDNAIIDQTLINENNVIDKRVSQSLITDTTIISQSTLTDAIIDQSSISKDMLISKPATAWTCTKLHSTSTSPNLASPTAHIFFLDKANYPNEYYFYNNYNAVGTDPYPTSVVVLDDQYRPYKAIHVGTDANGILEDGWKSKMVSDYILIPMYTQDDGQYYFLLGGKKYIGIDHNAEVYGGVVYKTIVSKNLEVPTNVYRESGEIPGDHKPIYPMAGDTDVQFAKIVAKGVQLKFHAESWTCHKLESTSMNPYSNVIKDDRYVGTTANIYIDRHGLGVEYYIKNNTGDAWNITENSGIILDADFKPYKILYIAKNDPKSIIPVTTSHANDGSAYFTKLIPLYTGDDGIMYFQLKGKKYIGKDAGAEVFGEVKYLRYNIDTSVTIRTNIYTDPTADATKHRAISPLDDDTKVIYSNVEITPENSFKVDGKEIQDPISWRCKQRHTTADPSLFVMSGSNNKDIFYLDLSGLGRDYYTYANYHPDTDTAYFPSSVVLDVDLKPYKPIRIDNTDPKSIFESSWKTVARPEKSSTTSFTLLIPLYTDTDGLYYFHIGGKKYKGPPHNAEIYGDVHYISCNGLNTYDNAYIDSRSPVADHKPIIPVTGDINIVNRTRFVATTSDSGFIVDSVNLDNYGAPNWGDIDDSPSSQPTSFQSLDYTVLDYDQLRYFPNYNTDSAYNVMITQKDNLIKIRLLDDKLVNYNMFIKVNNEYSSFENINIPVDDTLIYAGAFTTKQDGFKNDELIIAYLVKDNKSDYLLKYSKYVRVKELMTLSNEHALVFQLDSTGILNDSYIADTSMSRSSITRTDFVKSVFVMDYDIYILHQNGYLTKFNLENINHKLTLRAISTGNFGMNNTYKEDLFVDFYNNYYVRSPSDNTYCKASYTGGLIDAHAITSSTGIYEFNGRIYPNNQSNKLIYGDIKNDLMRSEVKNNLYTIYKLKNNIYVMIMIDGSMKIISNNKMNVLDVPYHRDQKYLPSPEDTPLISAGNMDNILVNITDVDLSNTITRHNNTGTYYMKNNVKVYYGSNNEVSFEYDKLIATFTRDPAIDLFIHEIKDFHITKEDSYILYRNAVVKLADKPIIVKDNNMICFMTYDNKLSYLQNINDEIIIKDLKKGKVLKRLTTGNTFTELLNRFTIGEKEYLIFNDGSILLNYNSRVIHSEVNITPGDDVVLEDDLVYLIRDGYIHNHNNELNHFIKGEHISLNTMLIEGTVIMELVNDNVFLNSNKHVDYNILKVENNDININNRKSTLLTPGKYIFILRMEDLDNPLIKLIFDRLNLKLEYGITLVNINVNIALSKIKEIDLDYMRTKSLNTNS